jgi:hypothetical protein
VVKKQFKIEFTDPQESLGMGGPYLANCYLSDKKLKHRFLVDNYFFSKNENILFLNRYTTKQQKKVLGLFNATANNRDFRIIACDLSLNCFYISIQTFDHLYLQEIKNDLIYYYVAFHSDLLAYQRTIPFTDKFFAKYDIKELYEE